VRVYTHRLRKKLGDDHGTMLKTVPGIGYQLIVEGAPATIHPAGTKR
jgi:DNA-binding response OmpR family regulator